MAGATTSRYYGESLELLQHYAWFYDNSESRSWPVGTLKPNDFGLFDMHGNIAEWCTGHAFDDRVNISAGSYGSDGSYVTAKADGGALPQIKYNPYGFRIVRTLSDDR